MPSSSTPILLDEENNPKLNDTIVNNIHINHFKENENDGEEETNSIHEVLEMNEMFKNDVNINVND